MIELRMRGVTPALITSALVSLAPLALSLYEKYGRGVAIDTTIILLAAAVALLPWASRLAGRATYRAALDDFALHVAGEALPWDKISHVTRRKSWRRDLIILERRQTTRVVLVTRDLFAGRLEPIDELEKRLPNQASSA